MRNLHGNELYLIWQKINVLEVYGRGYAMIHEAVHVLELSEIQSERREELKEIEGWETWRSEYVGDCENAKC